jgi:transcriptional regulator MraZ
MFVGAHERQLDDKGRVALPATYRAHLGEHCYLVKGTDKCVNVIPSEDFEQFGRELIAKVERGELALNSQRALASSAVLATVDRQGRVNIDEKLRTYADITLDSQVVVAGNLTRLEIWSPERYARVEAEGTDDIAGEQA